jgi:hypothetical protein
VRGYAASLNGFLLGLSMQARDGVPGTVLDASITETLRGWDVRATASKA